MTVLVTGGAGYIGSHMVLALVDRGEEVVVVDNLVTGFDWLVSPSAELVQGDIADAELVGRVIAERKVDAIVHFAGSIVVPESVSDPLKYYHNNTSKTRDLIATAVGAGVPHFIFSSTAATYGVTGAEPVTEDRPLLPISPYGRSKLMSEMMLEDVAAAHDLTYAALRYFNVAGADPQGRSGQATKGATHLIKVAVEAALGKRDGIEIFGTDYPTPDGTAIRDYIHVSDLAAAHLHALDHLRGGGDSIIANVGYGQGLSVRQVLDTVREVSKVDFPVRLSPRRAGDPPSIVADSSKARADLGWSPTLDDLPTIVEHALSWEKHLMRRNG
ncbi:MULTISPECIES: UDP-glucose 4-epimerase GalE [unclassified Aureimonas]|uniref:UDP-glucose 4-epimerase GalE n=1 Tax=unclassified Aureimonas TaxID=2615206 RepID=UPI0006F4C002|nr:MULTISPECIES: UDP-glucose 4-epimerase GalE [unclassified Aureimonas]KQT60658.1 UDP-glucose 4-epimerase [Aureimonas sp. Leaf460]KQT68787.1 UDP-glucose 4-epimerase [Aureimonas sp. Leaf427]